MNGDTLRLVEIAGVWVAGIGSLVAAIVALYLARRQTSRQLLARFEIYKDREARTEDSLVLSLVNTGWTPVQIKWVSSSGWPGKAILSRRACPEYFPLTVPPGETREIEFGPSGLLASDSRLKEVLDLPEISGNRLIYWFGMRSHFFVELITGKIFGVKLTRLEYLRLREMCLGVSKLGGSIRNDQ